ncbi:tetratricopeptide repeat protein [Azospirillum picis]|uniref:Tetratricopeptide (TPR) repeat protein n=1 Tax=Azospirillum picis TaxID=488438 RepID=A0ABU0MDS7_9PROT|nr:tetratricopeptide repeat protein [Azospirillum picis]MBP2297396.1 tetratricopeptide (TPR) repeat protein [Azospirillum picis]MDQ0531581.1 tetratricopeptide (TPR) repeat protein [Azospirillum picis]
MQAVAHPSIASPAAPMPPPGPADRSPHTPRDLAARLGEALSRHRAGELDAAERGYLAVLAAGGGGDRVQGDAYHLLGVLMHQRGRNDEAVRLIGTAISRQGGVAEYHANFGLALHALGRLDEAEAAYRRALDLREAYPEAHNSLGSALQERGRLEEAAWHYRRALDLRGGYAEAWANLGTLLRAQDACAEAETALRRALRLDPDHVAALTNLGVVLKETGRLAEAEAAHGDALRLAPGDAETLVNLALLREAQGRGGEAEALYRQALAQAPGFALARWNLALRLLGGGRLAEGLEEYEARFASRRVSAGRSLALPEWDGRTEVRRLLVWREQGLGDELMFGTALPDLAARLGPDRLVVEVDRRLAGLVGRALPGVAVRPETPAPADADAHLPMGSLPRLLRRSLAGFPPRTAWLAPDPRRAAAWRERLATLGPGLRVGICWGSQNMLGERKASYTALAGWAPLLTLPGLQAVTLQYDGREAEIAEVEAGLGIRIHRWPDIDLKNDLEGVAGLISSLDLVVTVASSVGEMAGALGVPVWRFGPGGDWTALGTGVRPWFPSMRLWSAQPGEDLAGVLTRMAAELRRMAPSPAAPVEARAVAAWLAEAQAMHGEGRWPEAEKAYQRILDLGGELPAALEGYGWLGFEAGRPDIAVTLLTRALAAEPSAIRHKRRALAHQALGAAMEAEADWQAAAALAPADVEAWGNLGALRLTRGAAAEAAEATGLALRHAPFHAGLWTNAGLARQAMDGDGEPAFRRALALDPAQADAWIALSAAALRDSGGALATERAAGRALALRPGDPAAAGNLGLAALALDRPSQAVAHLRLALRGRPGDPALLGNLALALERADDADAAGLAWWRVILLAPGSGPGWAGLADLRQRQGRPDAALKGWGRALALEPRRAEWRYNLGNALHAAGRSAEAVDAYRRAAEDDPDLTLATFNRGYAALARGDLAAGWTGLEARFAAGRAQPDRRFRIPPWDGGDPAGRTVLVWREQGVGDELMFSGCYPDLIARAGRVIVECEPRLVALFARSFPRALVRAATAVAAVGDPARGDLATGDPLDADCHVAAGSLPLHLRRHLSDFPAAGGWLRAEEREVERWRGWLAGDTGRRPSGEDGWGDPPMLSIGICWRSGLRGAMRDANYTTLDRWAPILTLPGLRLVNLQYDDCDAELAEAEARFGVTIRRPPLDLRNDLDGAAALTTALDLVVSAGTSVAEMAGALGVPVWRIGPGGDWTALGAGCRPWYPSMRLFAPRPGATLGDALCDAGRALDALRLPGALRTRG